jgi:hypothetical protein
LATACSIGSASPASRAAANPLNAEGGACRGDGPVVGRAVVIGSGTGCTMGGRPPIVRNQCRRAV